MTVLSKLKKAENKSRVRWFKYVKPYLPYFIIGPLCMIVEVIGEVLMPAFLSAIVDNVTPITDVSQAAEQSGISKIVTDIIEKFSQNVQPNDTGYILIIMVFMIITALLMMLGGVGGSYYGAKASVNFAADLRKDMYAKVQSYSFNNVDKFSTGSLVTRMTNDVTQMQNFVNMLLRMCLRSPGMLIGALIMAVSLNKQLAVVLAVTIPILLITQAIVISKGFPRFSRMQEKIDGLNSNVQESLTNVRVIKSFVREDHEKKRFRKSNKGLKDAGISAMNIMIIMSPLMSLIMNATTIAVVYLGSKYVTLGNMTVGNLAAFITYINQILFSLMMVTFLFMMSSRALASAKRIKEVLEEDLDISDENATCKDKTVENGDIEFRNVSFRYYKTSQDKVLDTINLKINSGETVGIIGSTGCGKTTLVSLIPRLYDTDEGEVLVDGTNVKDYSLKNLREGIGMVLQKNVLFSGTIEENLRWGDQDADMDTLRKAADHAQADGFVTSFTEGYQTELGQGGVNVSGGQKQRLCIARALLKKPKIIILDDSTSAVDTATEKKIREAFATELAGTTKIIIAQRISSVMEADKIIVINDGVITGMGTHDELIQTNTEYQEIYNSQMDSKKEGEK